jgi:hypothetical protein
MVAGTTPVVTLQGVCKDRQAKPGCEAVITRADLDGFISAYAPDAAKPARGRHAVQYARTLAYSALAEQQGLDKNPVLAKEIDEQVKLLRMRILAAAFLQNLQRQPATRVAETDIQKYYSEHRDQYEQAQLRRLSVPVEAPTENGRHPDRAEVRSVLEELRTRALAGEDFSQLQQDAFKQLHILAPPPPANVMTLRRDSVQGDETKAFDLKPGETSAVLDAPAAYVLIKLESKEVAPLETVRQEIEVALRGLHLQDQLSKLTKGIKTQFNLEYLEMPTQPDIFSAAAINQVPMRGGLRPGSNQP